MENERKRTPSGYVWDSCSLKFDLRLMGVSWSVSLATHWMILVIINVTMIEENHESRKERLDNQYDNGEQRRVITGSEAETARKLGQGIRYDHYGTAYIVKDPRFVK